MSEEQKPAANVTRRNARGFDLGKLYDTVARDWARDRPANHGDLIGVPTVVQTAKRYATGGRILDVGCGDGFACRLVAGFAAEVIGIDSSCEMLGRAQEHSASFRNVRYVLGDMLRLSALLGGEAKFDLCMGINAVCCLQSEDELRTLYSHLRAVLKPEGRVVMQIPHPLDGQISPPSAWLSDLDPLDSYFESGQLIRRRLRLLNGRWVTVGRYHFSISTHLNAALDAGLRLESCAEPRASDDDIHNHPDLARDGQRPSVWITIWRRG